MLGYVLLCYAIHVMICFELMKSMMHSLPMPYFGNYVMYEMMYKNYVRIITGFNMLWKNVMKEWRLSCIICYAMMESIEISCIIVCSHALGYFLVMLCQLGCVLSKGYVRSIFMFAMISCGPFPSWRLTTCQNI